MNEKATFKNMFKSEKIKKFIIIAGFAGIALIFISTFFNFNIGENTELPDTPENAVEEYCSDMQASIKDMLESIEGVGRTKVLLTIENSVEYVYRDNSDTKTKEIEPVIRGVVVVCQGGDNPVVVERVFSAVTKALNITTSKVCVTKLSNSNT